MSAPMAASDRVGASIRLLRQQQNDLDDLVGKAELTRGVAALFTAMVATEPVARIAAPRACRRLHGPAPDGYDHDLIEQPIAAASGPQSTSRSSLPAPSRAPPPAWIRSRGPRPANHPGLPLTGDAADIRGHCDGSAPSSAAPMRSSPTKHSP
jgi:hypothetical protein